MCFGQVTWHLWATIDVWSQDLHFVYLCWLCSLSGECLTHGLPGGLHLLCKCPCQPFKLRQYCLEIVPFPDLICTLLALEFMVLFPPITNKQMQNSVRDLLKPFLSGLPPTQSLKCFTVNFLVIKTISKLSFLHYGGMISWFLFLCSSENKCTETVFCKSPPEH